MPALIKKYEQTVAVNRLKKSYSEVSNMIRMAEAKNGPLSEWPEWSSDKPWYRKDMQKVMEKYLVPQVSGAKIYGNDIKDGNFYTRFMCYEEGGFLHNNNGGTGQYSGRNNSGIVLTSANEIIYSMRFADQTCVGFKPVSNGNYVAFVYIDPNGSNSKPNMRGRDFFGFILDYDGRLLPMGNELSGNEYYTSSCPNSSYWVADCSAAKIMHDGWRIKSDYKW